MSQVHNINSFIIGGVCLRAHQLKSIQVMFNNNQEEVLLTKQDGSDFITNHHEPLAVNSTATGKTSGNGIFLYS